MLDSKGKVHMVFELIPGGNLETLTRKRRKPFSEAQIRTIFFQLLQALTHMHAMSYMHRDVKPENILLHSYSPDGDIKVKLADLGLAKRLGLSNRPHTTYVATRWYRSPEILLRLANYGYPSDMWALGAVMAELICLGEPLFPGDDEKDQLVRVVALRGHPAVVGWQCGDRAMKSRRIRLPKTTPSSLRSAIPNATLPMLQLISDLLEMDPAKRPTAQEALAYPLFVIPPHTELPLPRFGKRRKVDVGGVETARTADWPGSRWSADSDAEAEGGVANERNHTTRVGREKSVEVAREARALAASSAAEAAVVGTEQRFTFALLGDRSDSDTRGLADVRLRAPAGHFDLRI